MLHFTKTELHILDRLSQGPRPVSFLISPEDGIATATCYTAVRSLIKQGILYKIGELVTVNLVWIQRQQDALSNLSNAHTFLETTRPHELSRYKELPHALLEGKKHTYTFNNYYDLDTFWMSVPLSLLASKVGKNTNAWFVWEPIPFWYLYDSKSFVATLDAMSTYSWDVRYCCYDYGTSSVSTMMKWARKNKLRSSVVSDAKLPLDRYISVHGPFVITAKLGQLHNLIEECMKKEELTKEKLIKLLSENHKVSITIENNQKKAEALFVLLSSYFSEKR